MDRTDDSSGPHNGYFDNRDYNDDIILVVLMTTRMITILLLLVSVLVLVSGVGASAALCGF